MAIIFDPILSKLRKQDIIPQLDTDPASPKPQSAWIKGTVTTGGVGSGEPYGLLLALTQPGADTTASYTLKYRTKEGTTVSVGLT